MKIGESGQVTIPKEIRDKFGLNADIEVDFQVDNGAIVLKKTPRKLNLAKWRGRCKKSFLELGYATVDEFIDYLRGR